MKRAESLTILERIADKSKRISAVSGIEDKYDRIVPTKDGSGILRICMECCKTARL